MHRTQISNNALTNIIEHLSGTLEKLDVHETKIKLAKMLELKSMEKLKVLNWFPLVKDGFEQEQILKEKLPYLSVNNEPKGIKIASSSQIFNPESGFWEIHAKRLSLFRKNYWK